VISDAPPNTATESLPVLVLNFAKSRCREIERLLPPGFAKAALGAQQWIEQTIGMSALHVPFDTLRAELSLIERELLPRLESDHLVTADLELESHIAARRSSSVS
jgi:hypothetical protein